MSARFDRVDEASLPASSDAVFDRRRPRQTQPIQLYSIGGIAIEFRAISVRDAWSSYWDYRWISRGPRLTFSGTCTRYSSPKFGQLIASFWLRRVPASGKHLDLESLLPSAYLFARLDSINSSICYQQTSSSVSKLFLDNRASAYHLKDQTLFVDAFELFRVLGELQCSWRACQWHWVEIALMARSPPLSSSFTSRPYHYQSRERWTMWRRASAWSCSARSIVFLFWTRYHCSERHRLPGCDQREADSRIDHLAQGVFLGSFSSSSIRRSCSTCKRETAYQISCSVASTSRYYAGSG